MNERIPIPLLAKLTTILKPTHKIKKKLKMEI